MPNILALETKKYAIKLENFEGPLDLLCNLIEKNKMSIYEIKLDEITDQYIEFLDRAQELNLEVASEFLTLASTLLYIKSKKLLPNKQEESEEISEDELIRRIIEYKKYKEIIKKFKEQYENSGDRLYGVREEIQLPKQKLEKEYNKEIIPELYKKLIERNEQKKNQNAKNIEKIAISESYSVGSKVKEMFKVLIKQKKFVFNKLFSIKEHNKQEVVTAFSGMLEMSRRSKVITTQEEVFGDILVEKSKK